MFLARRIVRLLPLNCINKIASVTSIKSAPAHTWSFAQPGSAGTVCARAGDDFLDETDANAVQFKLMAPRSTVCGPYVQSEPGIPAHCYVYTFNM